MKVLKEAFLPLPPGLNSKHKIQFNGIMPKRTNKFQKFITQIYEQMAGIDDKVVESAMVKERGSATEREIDILLQKRIFGTDIRMAIECRSRRDKDDIEWIDGLVGKYRDLDVHKVIAVSKSGFTKAAKEKAELNRIDTLTLTEALETNWPAEFACLGMARLLRRDNPDSVSVITDPPLPAPLSLETPLLKESGEQVGTIEQAAKAIYEKRKEEINKEIGEQFLTFFKTLKDLQSKHLLVELSQSPTNPTFIEDEEGKRYRVTSLTLRIRCSFSYEPATVDHYVLGDAQVTLGVIKDEPSKDAFSVMAIQVANKPNQAKVHIELLVK